MNSGGTWQFVLLDAFSQSMLQSSKSKARSPWMASPPAQGHLSFLLNQDPISCHFEKDHRLVWGQGR